MSNKNSISLSYIKSLLTVWPSIFSNLPTALSSVQGGPWEFKFSISHYQLATSRVMFIITTTYLTFSAKHSTWIILLFISIVTENKYWNEIEIILNRKWPPNGLNSEHPFLLSHFRKYFKFKGITESRAKLIHAILSTLNLPWEM